jgi:hypothetical protein
MKTKNDRKLTRTRQIWSSAGDGHLEDDTINDRAEKVDRMRHSGGMKATGKAYAYFDGKEVTSTDVLHFRHRRQPAARERGTFRNTFQLFTD